MPTLSTPKSHTPHPLHLTPYFLSQMKGFLVGENSPSLWPTISSLMSTSLYILPLCTWNRSPTKLGRIVAERACVRIGGVLFPGSGRTIGRLRVC